MVTLQKSTQELICQSIRERIASGDLEAGTELCIAPLLFK